MSLEMSIDWTMIAWRAGLIAEALALLFIAKVARDLLLLRRGYRVDEQLTQRDNLAAAVDLAAFMLACVVALLDSFVIEGESWARQATSVATTGLVVLPLLALNGWLTDKALLRGIDDLAEVHERRNIAVAVVRAGAVLGAALATRAAFGHPNDWLTCAAWALIGQVMLIAVARIYERVSPYDDLAEVKQGNVAAALPLMGVLVAVGVTVEGAIYGEVVEWGPELLSASLYLLVSAALIWGARGLLNSFLLPKGDLTEEITRDRNVGVGLLEATVYISLAEVMAFFFS
jgi:uncharacterized membrane protein YjfL (UPF0719 family)